MYIRKELDLKNFRAWSGGADTLELIKEQGLIEDVEIYLEEVFPVEMPTEGELNDILWYDEYINDMIDWGA